jgi:hypothetical protein
MALLGSRLQVQSIVLFAACDQHRISLVSGVNALGFGGLFAALGTRVDNALQGRPQQLGIMHVCSAGDER